MTRAATAWHAVSTMCAMSAVVLSFWFGTSRPAPMPHDHRPPVYDAGVPTVGPDARIPTGYEQHPLMWDSVRCAVMYAAAAMGSRVFHSNGKRGYRALPAATHWQGWPDDWQGCELCGGGYECRMRPRKYVPHAKRQQ